MFSKMAVLLRRDYDPESDAEEEPLNFQTELLVLQNILVGLALIVVLARSYVRYYIIKAFKIDDWVMLFAQVCHWFPFLLRQPREMLT